MTEAERPSGRFTYPDARRMDLVEELHGSRVADPYRWLEELDSEETRDWIGKQNRLTFGYLESAPQRAAIRKRLEQLWNYERFTLPNKKSNRYFYYHNDGLQNQSVLYWTEGLEGEPRELIDPNRLSDDGTVALMMADMSEDGRLIAYGLSSAGSDWVEIRVREVDTGEDLSDHLKWVKFSGISWTHDGKGFFYSRYDEPEDGEEYRSANYFHKLCYHRLGTPQSEDIIAYERPDRKELLFFGSVTDDGRYLVVSAQSGTSRENAVYCMDLEDSENKIVELFGDFDAEYDFVGNDGARFLFRTDLDAPRGRLIAKDMARPKKKLQELVPERGDMLQYVRFVGGRLIGVYLQDARSAVIAFETDGSVIGDIALPGIGSVWGFGGRPDDPEVFFLFTSFTHPGTIFRMSTGDLEYSVFREPRVDFDPADYGTEQVFYESGDGTRIPMFLCFRNGLEKSGDNPVLLSGYGGFGNATTPFFAIPNLVWMEMGGILARPNLRGGSEYGTEWHDAGRLQSKQNVFDDFISAAEWLIKQGYTRKEKLAISGASNGGLLIGACMTQRPDLFGACLPDVGVMDMLRFHQFTIGWAWVSDYGSPEDPELFETLLAYSPYHNLREGTAYPPTLVTTADHDDRVFPAHSFKFAAALQHAHCGDSPVLIRVERRAGHGGTTPTSKRIAVAADRLSFVVEELGITPALSV